MDTDIALRSTNCRRRDWRQDALLGLPRTRGDRPDGAAAVYRIAKAPPHTRG